MRILQVYKDYDPPIKGGIEGHLNLLANGLVRRGVDVHVLVSNTSSVDQITREGAIPLTKAGQWGRLASAPLNPGFPRLLRKLSRASDIVHFHFPNPTGEASALAVGLKMPMVVTYHSDIVRQKRLKLLYQPLMHRFLGRVDRIIATSPKYVQSSQTLSRFKAKCEIIPLGVDTHRFPVHGNQTAKGHPEILFIGQFRYYKGLHVLIQSMGRVPKGELKIVGSGPLEPELRTQVLESGLSAKVSFLGELSHSELNRQIQRCNVLVLPSVERSEAFGIVIMEAMACGKAVISTELGTGTSYVNLHRHTGLVVQPNDPVALATAINYLVDHPEKCRKMGQSGRNRILREFTADQMVERTLGVYQSLLNLR